ncbi:MAG: hypothetical protein RLY31_3021 [Bacteroidota bacterium]|jgi:hypothetical protein
MTEKKPEKKPTKKPILQTQYWECYRPFSYPLYQYVMMAKKELDLEIAVYDVRPDVDGYDEFLNFEYYVYQWTGTDYKFWFHASEDRYLEIFLAAVLHYHIVAKGKDG